jgi:hypothetical protein
MGILPDFYFCFRSEGFVFRHLTWDSGHY